ncbi:MAG: glycosyltransferase [Hasllibacter sp.]
MILVTVGTQLPFPRLLAAMDALAAGLDEEVIAQAGPDPDGYPSLQVHRQIAPGAFDALATRARVLVAHAGIGTVLTARAHGVPLVAMPRRAALGEHRNDHQMATAARLEGRAGIAIAWEAGDLPPLVADPGAAPAAAPGGAGTLVARVRDALDGGRRDGGAVPGRGTMPRRRGHR